MSTIASLLAMFFPLFAVLYIANIGERQRQSTLNDLDEPNAHHGMSELDVQHGVTKSREQPHQAAVLFCYLLLGLGFAAAVLIGLALQGMSLLLTPDLLASPDEAPTIAPGVDFSFESLPLLALGVWLPGVGGLLLLLRPIRSWIATFTHIDPDNPVHTVALTFVMLVIVNLMMTLGIGLGNLAALLENGLAESSEAAALTLWTQQILMALMALVGVGWLSRLNFGASIARLGLVRPTLRQSLIGLGLGLLMVPVVLAATYFASVMGWGVDPDVERLTEQMIGPLFESPLLGILTIGLAAALGEELLFRGAVQPRFGILLTSAVFALVHSNYGISVSTVIVFVLGLLLGWVRIRYNTSTAMILHAAYNMTLGILATLSISFLDF